MRVGVVCEGQTDYVAIISFLGNSLRESGIQAEFELLQSRLDNTLGGWDQVLTWLHKNPPVARIEAYFNGGLFNEGLSSPGLDCLLIHLDSDILGKKPVASRLQSRHQYIVKNPQTPAGRAREIRKIIAHVGQFSTMTNADKARHVPAPAVESTETWCVAAFHRQKKNFESFSGQQLVDAFMTALEKSEGRQPQSSYGAEADKGVKRRKKYCNQFANQSSRIINSCPHFKQIHQDLLGLVPN